MCVLGLALQVPLKKDVCRLYVYTGKRILSFKNVILLIWIEYYPMEPDANKVIVAIYERIAKLNHVGHST